MRVLPPRVIRPKRGDKMSRMSEPAFDARLYAYEMAPELGVEPRGVQVVFRPEPIRAGEQLMIGEPPDARHWIVVRVESTGNEGQPFDLPLSGPPNSRRPDAIWGGRLVLCPLT